MSGRETCLWRMCWLAKGKFAVSTQCGHEFLFTKNMRLHARLRKPSFACPYCGLEERRTNESNWDPSDEQLDEWGM